MSVFRMCLENRRVDSTHGALGSLYRTVVLIPRFSCRRTILDRRRKGARSQARGRGEVGRQEYAVQVVSGTLPFR